MSMNYIGNGVDQGMLQSVRVHEFTLSLASFLLFGEGTMVVDSQGVA